MYPSILDSMAQSARLVHRYLLELHYGVALNDEHYLNPNLLYDEAQEAPFVVPQILDKRQKGGRKRTVLYQPPAKDSLLPDTDAPQQFDRDQTDQPLTERQGISRLFAYMGTGQGNKTSDFLLNGLDPKRGKFPMAFNDLLECVAHFEAAELNNREVVRATQVAFLTAHISAAMDTTCKGDHKRKYTLLEKFGPYFSERVQTLWCGFLGDLLGKNPETYTGDNTSCRVSLCDLSIVSYPSSGQDDDHNLYWTTKSLICPWKGDGGFAYASGFFLCIQIKPCIWAESRERRRRKKANTGAKQRSVGEGSQIYVDSLVVSRKSMANTLHIKSNLTFDCLIQAEVRNGVVREIGDLKAGQMRMFPLADIEGCAVGEIINPSSVKLNVKARTIPGQLENPLEVVSPVEIEFSGSANGVARFIIGYDATPGLTIDRVWYRYNV
ncbi:hypothetical protein R3P38DRAFT_2772363 [Favolaschia claudopus]|uniref:Uncharacterized protein n=1 Tax=Favolaschia claudopus TaxID=2862362 RepID=A0AAW0C4I3_9AGAR